MWLRDALPYNLPGARILTYGFDTRLAGSQSFQNLEDAALIFRRSLGVALGNRPPDRPLIFLAHSLGGLVLKQALIQMASGDGVDICNFQSTYGILFFGVPNQGMDIHSLLAMVGSQLNSTFLTMLSKHAGSLQGLIDRFRMVFDFKDSKIVSFYEMRASRTAMKDATGKFSMSGDYAVLVDRFSAKGGRSWEDNNSFLQPIDRNHSDMVKYSEYDEYSGIVRSFLAQFAKAAPAVIRDRIRGLEPSITLYPSNVQPSALDSQPLGEEAETEQQERVLEAMHIPEGLGRSMGNPPTGIEGSSDRRQKGSSEAVVDREARAPLSSQETNEEEDDLELSDLKDSNGLEIFASAGFDVKVKQSCELGLTWAAQKGHVSLTHYLLDKHTSIESKDKCGWTALHWAAFTANLELFRLLLSHGAKHDATTDCGDTTLHLASLYSEGYAKTYAESYVGSSSDREAICLQLLDTGLPVDVRNAQQETPLICAATCGLECMVVLLASVGAVLTSWDQFNCTPLMRAAENGQTRVVKILIEMQKKTHSYFTPEKCLFYAAKNGMESAVRTLLDAGLMVDAAVDSGYTALIGAAEDGHQNVVRLLLDNGAHINARNMYGETALILAVYKPTEQSEKVPLDTIKLLVERGANVRAVNNNRFSALHYAALYNCREEVDHLLMAGADPLALNIHRDLPIDIASRKGHDDVVERFKQEINMLKQQWFRSRMGSVEVMDETTDMELDHQPAADG